MKIAFLPVAVVLGFGLMTSTADAQTHKTKKHHAAKHHYVKPKNEITKLRADRKKDHTVRQITPDPKKSPGKHADNLSKNINHEINRESKDFNHFFQGKKNKK